MAISGYLRTVWLAMRQVTEPRPHADGKASVTADGKLIDRQLAERFSEVFRSKLWGGDESLSGPGSRLDNPMVIQALDSLDHAIQTLGVRTIADIPCGDFNWFRLVTEKYPDLRYTGFDIVVELVDDNRRKYPREEFRHFDIVSDVPERFDLIFTKELFIHLRNRDVFRAVANMKASGSKYLIASNSFGVRNEDLFNDELGYARPIDLCVEPFNFPAPVWRNHFYGAWRLEDIPTS